MRRRLLIITKDPEFDVRGEVVLGQCEPFTSGWTLIMIVPEGAREMLLVGTYTDLRRIQESCALIEEPAQIRKRVNDMRALLTCSVTETIAVRIPNNGVEASDVTKELAAITPRDLPTQTPGGFLNVECNEDVLVATVVQPERADDADYLKDEILALLDRHPKAVLMDFGRVAHLSPGSFKQLAGLRDRFRESGADFALCNVPGDVQQKLKNMRPKDSLPIFETQESALAALKA